MLSVYWPSTRGLFGSKPCDMSKKPKQLPNKGPQKPAIADSLLVELRSIPGVGKRKVRVHLPEGLERRRTRPPLLFMFDGQNIFHDKPSYAGGWHLHRSIDSRVKGKRLAPVVVGLDHGGKLRLSELDPYKSAKQGGLFDPMMHWICETLLPEMRKKYDLAPGPGGCIVGGSSMGGASALAAHIQRPDVFGGAWAMSPSLHVGRGGLFRTFASTSKPHQSRIYVDAGGRESRGHLVKGCDRLTQIMRQKGWQEPELMYRVVKSGTHNERHWRVRSPRALRFFFG